MRNAVFLLIALGAVSNVRAQVTEYFVHSSFVAAAGKLNIEGFDNLSTGSALSGNEFIGISIAQLDGMPMTLIDPRDAAPGLLIASQNVNSLPNGLSASLYYSSPATVGFNNGVRDAFRITFRHPSLAAGLWIGNVGAFAGDTTTPTVITVYDDGGAVIASETFTQGHAGQIGIGVNNRFFYGVTADHEVAHIDVVNGCCDLDGIFLDDVNYPMGQWSDLGFGVAGTFGVPTLEGVGALADASPGKVSLAGVPAGSPTILCLSLNGSAANLMCGTLVPFPNTFFVPIVAGGGGTIVVTWPSWPASISGTSVYFQYIAQDPLAICGVSFSNAIKADAP